MPCFIASDSRWACIFFPPDHMYHSCSKTGRDCNTSSWPSFIAFPTFYSVIGLAKLGTLKVQLQIRRDAATQAHPGQRKKREVLVYGSAGIAVISKLLPCPSLHGFKFKIHAILSYYSD